MRPADTHPLSLNGGSASSRNRLIREWIVFALCLGVGGHLALAALLHVPERWPWSQAGLYGLLLGVAAYVVVQVLRLCWWVCRGRAKDHSIEA
ncbi:MAG: hypothetical protein ACKOBZ_08375 [Nitrospira sp.]